MDITLAGSWKKFRGRSDRLNHTPYMREVEMASYFEVEAMVRGYHQYKEIWEAEVGEQLATAHSLIKNPHE